MAISDFSTQADNNSFLSRINIGENCPPSTLNNALRQIMADMRQYANDNSWFAYGSGSGTATYGKQNDGSFTVSGGDSTKAYSSYRRVRVLLDNGNFAYGSIASATSRPGAGDTLVQVNWDGGQVPSGNYVTVYLGVDNLSLVTTTVMPSGTVLYIVSQRVPAGFLECAGQTLLRASYPNLYSAVGNVFGTNYVDNFKLPDLRGEFIRGWDNGRGVDSNRSFGTAQASENLRHGHQFSGVGVGAPNSQSNWVALPIIGTPESINHIGNRQTAGDRLGAIYPHGGDEARPRNIALLPIIKT
ncbi:MAG: phage tail protein [Candidatus Pacebacteria bacterium]|nr:phage tail protein [Candidatus Paceibacterota bacterium]